MQGRTVTVEIVVVDPPTHFAGYDSIELVLSTKDGNFPPVSKTERELIFEVSVEIRADKSGVLQGWGPAVNRQGDGVRFIYLSWIGTQGGFPAMFRRLKVGLDQVPGFPGPQDRYSVRVSGQDKRGGPACARATLAP
ncbi:MAG: DUF5990 family protein [Fimbriimonas sp.]